MNNDLNLKDENNQWVLNMLEKEFDKAFNDDFRKLTITTINDLDIKLRDHKDVMSNLIQLIGILNMTKNNRIQNNITLVSALILIANLAMLALNIFITFSAN